ncbi:MAG: hypothetical protein SH819_01270 [Cytophagales bacterium]|nr:hypothetical protein [Cytophagales bacterium]
MIELHSSHPAKDQVRFIVDGFRDRTLPKEQWTHEAHLVTSLWFFSNHTEYEAISYLRSGIITFNFQKGGKNTPTDGYHETMTLFWCRIICDFVEVNKNMSLSELCQSFLGSEQASRDFPFRYYSRDLLLSVKARAIWVEPDLRQLD